MPSLFKQNTENSSELFLTDNYHELELKISAFKKIYRALWHAQNNSAMLKTNFLQGKESLPAHELANDIKTHYQNSPKSRTAQAWNLSLKYYEQCHADNPELFNEIYRYANENTRNFGITLFSPAPIPKTFNDKDIGNRTHIADKTGFLIALELEWSPKNYEVRDPLPTIKVM